MKFIKKTDALTYYTHQIKNQSIIRNIGLFQEDINRIGAKCFYVENTNKIYQKIISLDNPHFYEFWTENTSLKFSMDIDYKITNQQSESDTNNLLEKIIKIVIDSAKEFYDYTYEINQIIVLENKLQSDTKYSAHIIFNGLNFENYFVLKDFFKRMDKIHNLKSLYVDDHIYNKTCLRLYLNSKMNNNLILIPKQLTINNMQTNYELEPTYDFFLSSMITRIQSSNRLISKNDIINKSISYQLKHNILDISNQNTNINFEHIIMSLPPKYYNEYDYWIKIGMILYQFDMFELWDNFSKQSIKYKLNETTNRWKSFSPTLSKITVGSLIKWAKDENIDNIYINKKLDINQIVNTYPIKPIIINTNTNLLVDNITTISQAKLTPDNYRGLIDKKLLAVQSEKGTGKTSNLFEILFDKQTNQITDSTSILFVSSRITFGYKLLGDLKEFGFKLYSDIKEHHIHEHRVICQIDSLMRVEYDKYDIIIIDECETLARYMTSNHFTRNPKSNLIISMFEMRINDSNQLFIMDADLSDRCINYYMKLKQITNISDIHILINNFKPYNEYQLTYCHYATWLNKILIQIESNKKLVIAMASNAKAKDLYKKLTETFAEKKILFIHRETSDEDKKILLLNVNEEWVKYDIVIYTPSVCMGVSFDIINHFDNIFAYGCHESLGAQEWCQMIHRVRSPINKEIFISIDNYKEYDKDEQTVDYKTVEKMLCSDYYLTNYNLHTNIICKKITRVSNISPLDNDIELDKIDEISIDNNFLGSVEQSDKVLYYPYKDEPIYDLYVRNSLELIENKLNFAASFFGYAKFKEYKLSYAQLEASDNDIIDEMKTIREERIQLEEEEKVNGILNAKDISIEEYTQYQRQKDELITKNELYEIYRYNLRKCYTIEQPNILEKNFITNYYDKDLMKLYRNISTILSTPTQTTETKLSIMCKNEQYDSIISNCYNEFSTKNKYTYHYYPIEIIKHYGFDINNLLIKQSNMEIICKTYDIIAWLNEYKDDISFKYGFNTNLKDLTKLKETDQLKYINKILDIQYGLKIKRCNQTSDKDNIMYKLDSGDRWNDLGFEIKPIELQLKQSYNQSHNIDTTNLDLFIDE